MAQTTILYTIRRKAGLTQNPFITDDRLENKRKQAENEINSAIYARYQLLAAGYIDYEDFGKDGAGVQWLGEGRAILKQITAGTRRLLDSNFVELPASPSPACSLAIQTVTSRTVRRSR